MLESLHTVRSKGVRIILVTGRILAELQNIQPDVQVEFDAIVAENGAVIVHAGRTHNTARPVDSRLSKILRAARVGARVGDVLLACSGADEEFVLSCIRRLGFDYQLVRNRGELMVLPAGVTKATGLKAALTELGISPHNTIGIGDAENDESLLDVCEVSVAVANAVDALKAQADIILDEPDGVGVAKFLRGPVVEGTDRCHSERFELRLGTADDGSEVKIPSSQFNLLITSGSGEGKSYLAGLIAEQLIEACYSLLIIDPEGDFIGLEQLQGAIVVNAESLLSPATVARLLAGLGTSIIIDFSGVGAEARSSYLAMLLPRIDEARALTGMPQWVFVDEAPDAIDTGWVRRWPSSSGTTGICLITWRPDSLQPDVSVKIDALLIMGGGCSLPPSVPVMAAELSGIEPQEILSLMPGTRGRAILVQRGNRPIPFTSGSRRTSHFRHERKYGRFGVELERAFCFYLREGAVTGAIARNLNELETELLVAPPAVLCHHCPRHDFSRWIRDVFHDNILARQISLAESEIQSDSPMVAIEDARIKFCTALRAKGAMVHVSHTAGETPDDTSVKSHD